MVSSFVPDPYYAGARLPLIWLCLRGKKPFRDGRAIKGPNLDMTEYIAQVLVDSGKIAPQVWDFKLVWMRGPNPDQMGRRLNAGDTLLQYILEPASTRHAQDKTTEEAHLCEAVAAKFTLQQLCHRNALGICALSYAEQHCRNTGPAWQQGAWTRVRDAIKFNMMMRCQECTPPLEEFVWIVTDLRQSSLAAGHTMVMN